jgi:transcriptional regulator with XRE-family HTH domain
MGQVELGKRSGVAQQTISGIERDYREPQASTLRKLADALNVPVVAFFQESTDPDGGPGGGRRPEGIRITTAHIDAAREEHSRLNAALSAGEITIAWYSRRIADLYRDTAEEVADELRGKAG